MATGTSQFAPGRRLIVQYSVAAGEPLHERMVLCKSSGSFYALGSPDGDVYTECVAGSEDILQIWSVDLRGNVPASATALNLQIYRFTDFLLFRGVGGAQLVREGITDASVHRGRYFPDRDTDPSEAQAEALAVIIEGGGEPPPGFLGAPMAAAVLPPAAPAPMGGAGLPAGYNIGVPAPVALEEWVISSLLDSGTVPRYGDRHVLTNNAVSYGAVGIDILLDGRVVSVKRILSAEVPQQLEKAEQCVTALRGALGVPGAAGVTPTAVDARVLPIRYAANGKRGREYVEAVELLQEVAWPDWPLSGPRTARWFCRFIKETNQIPKNRTSQWMRLHSIAEGDRVKYEHGLLCDIIELAVVYDQLDISSLASFELATRRVQMLEEAYAANPKQPRVDSHFHFMGQGRRASAVAPSLVAHVASELRDEAAVAKERRKAREESALAAKKG